MAPISTKPFITRQNINDGYVVRYFTSFVSNPKMIYEIDSKQYDTLRKNPYYTAIQLNWYITGEIEDITTPASDIIKGTRQRNLSSIDFYEDYVIYCVTPWNFTKVNNKGT
jgi:hypothetical protein